MADEDESILEKTNRINVLFDFYELLLTDKQRTFLKHYFHDNFTLAEIAEEFGVSRQAVYENIKRAELRLEQYEEKLGLQKKHEIRLGCYEQMDVSIRQLPVKERVMLADSLQKLRGLEQY